MFRISGKISINCEILVKKASYIPLCPCRTLWFIGLASTEGYILLKLKNVDLTVNVISLFSPYKIMCLSANSVLIIAAGHFSRVLQQQCFEIVTQMKTSNQ